MTIPSSKTQFPLGAYVGQPDVTSASGQAAFEQSLSSFDATMGAPPEFLDTYNNYNFPITQWADQNSFQAASWAATPALKSSIPVIGLPLASTQDSAIQDYQAFASGQYDGMLSSMVQSWANAGVTQQDWRLGWEMNLAGPTYAGDQGSAEQQAWIEAFQHVSTVIHQAATKDGVTAQVIWNPGTTSYSNAGSAVASLYPGSQYVDIIGADVYADAYPYSLYNFTTGTSANSFAQWSQNASNLTHYYSYPAATQYGLNSSSGHATSLQDLIALAQQTGKPLGIVETGAGNSNAGHDIQDNPVFVSWLSQTLTKAQQAGISVDFVNIWDSNDGGNYEFSNASDGKPQEAAAWSKYFGAQTDATSSTATAAAPSQGGEGEAASNVVCYVSGTLILTVRGNVAVEHLAVGDLVVTSSGTKRPIRWLGHRKIVCQHHPRPREVMPVRISAHAFALDRPTRDLWVSPGHSICVDMLGEVLIPTAALVNDTTIRQIQVDSVTYWHIELDSHDILLAENLPAESYIDCGNRSFFVESGVIDLAADPAAGCSRVAEYCRPFHGDGPLVAVARAQLQERAVSLGWMLDRSDPFAELHLLVDGTRLEPITRGLVARFTVPDRAREVWLQSTTARPCDVAASLDGRDLGVFIAGLTVDDGFAPPRALDLADPHLCVGFHHLEDGARRWTTGRARLPEACWVPHDSAADDGFFLRVTLAGPALPRWTAPVARSSASKVAGPSLSA